MINGMVMLLPVRDFGMRLTPGVPDSVVTCDGVAAVAAVAKRAAVVNKEIPKSIAL